MDIEALRIYCLDKEGVTEAFPFDEGTLVFKVGGKIFALTALDESPRVNLKCEPGRAVDLRERYEEIIPGYHMNKKHWNTVIMDGKLPDQLITDLIDHSYDLIIKSLPVKIREKI